MESQGSDEDFYTKNYIDFDDNESIDEDLEPISMPPPIKKRKRKSVEIILMSDDEVKLINSKHNPTSEQHEINESFLVNNGDVFHVNIEQREQYEIELLESHNKRRKPNRLPEATSESEIILGDNIVDLTGDIAVDSHPVNTNIQSPRRKAKIKVHFSCTAGEKTFTLEPLEEIESVCDEFCSAFNIDPDSLTMNGFSISKYSTANIVTGVITGDPRVSQDTERINIIACFEGKERTVAVANPLNVLKFVDKLRAIYGYDQISKVETPDDTIKMCNFDQDVDVEEDDKIYLIK